MLDHWTRATRNAAAGRAGLSRRGHSLLARAALCGAVAVLAAACSSTTHSTNLDTAGFYVTYTLVSAEGRPGRAVAEFRVLDEEGSDLELVGGDAIAVDGRPLLRVDDSVVGDELALMPWAPLRYEVEVGGRARHIFTLVRDGEAAMSRPLDEVAAPAPTLGGTAMATARYTDPLTVIWAPLAGSTVRVVATATDTAHCSSPTLVESTADVGSYALDAARLHPAGDATGCTFRVTVVRTRSEPMDAPFHGGAVRTIASGSLELTLR